jgi:hypothetical protein
MLRYPVMLLPAPAACPVRQPDLGSAVGYCRLHSPFSSVAIMLVLAMMVTKTGSNSIPVHPYP